jgi:hypothetical protein
MGSKSKTRSAVAIVGVVGPFGAGGGRLGQETRWTLRFRMAPWRSPDGQIEEQELHVHQLGLSEAELRKALKRIAAYDVLRLRVRLDEPPPQPPPQRGWRYAPLDPNVRHAALASIVRRESADAELNARAAALQKPATRKDPFFGKLTLNRILNAYETRLQWNARRAKVYLRIGGVRDEEKFLRAAEELWRNQRALDRQVRECAVKHLLKTKNQSWLDDGEPPCTHERFKRRMKLTSIDLAPRGKFMFSFNDGGLFDGHCIVVRGSLARGPSRAEIAG